MSQMLQGIVYGARCVHQVARGLLPNTLHAGWAPLECALLKMGRDVARALDKFIGTVNHVMR